LISNLLEIRRGYWQVLEESDGRQVVAEGVVNRKQHSIRAKVMNAARNAGMLENPLVETQT
jgi:hypothetical protein